MDGMDGITYQLPLSSGHLSHVIRATSSTMGQ